MNGKIDSKAIDRTHTRSDFEMPRHFPTHTTDNSRV